MFAEMWPTIVGQFHWQSFLSGLLTGLVLPALKGIGRLVWDKKLKGMVVRSWNYRRRDCGHRAGSWATDPRTGKTECSNCYNTRMSSR
jgi:hypothetical protein